ncbi:MAG: HlyD family efflux transporter periplasmic adaptor subunit [Bacteroidetes bacterium]|nr:MAG: HlyD family efflux transporter periplasmic adaptor subunit [Bacteroidota bacterium]
MNKGCVIALVLVLGVFSVLLGAYFYNQSKKDPVVYTFEKPTIANIVKKTVATGSIKPRQEVQIKPQVSGVIDQLFVEAGELVKKGQKIARIKLVPSQININNAQNQVELARLRYEDAKRELKRQKDIFDKKLDIEASRARYETDLKEFERQRQLFENGVVSEQAFLVAKRNLEISKAEFENAEIIAGNTLRQLETEVDIRNQELTAAINNLQLLREGATQNSRQVNNIIVSTVDGMVLDVPLEEGASVVERNNFNEGTTIATIADMNNLIFLGKVDESDVGKLREGMSIELTIGAIENEKFGATLEYISPKGVEEEGTVKFEIKAAIQPANKTFLRAGYSASGDIILDHRDSVLAIKERDVLFQKDSTFVEIKVGDQQFEKHPVRLGLSDGILIEVLDGLDSTTLIKVQKN